MMIPRPPLRRRRLHELLALALDEIRSLLGLIGVIRQPWAVKECWAAPWCHGSLEKMLLLMYMADVQI